MSKIVWVEDPKKFIYLRAANHFAPTKRFPVKTIGKGKAGFWKLFGYYLKMRCDFEGKYWFVFFYLRTYDAGCPEDDGTYNKEFGPAEGILVSELLTREQ